MKELVLGGTFSFQQIRDGKVIDEWEQDNLVVDEGLSYVLGNSYDGSTASITTWYLGVYKNNYTPQATDVMATFPGAGVANEANAEYTEATRPTWVEAGVTAKSITNSASPAVFTFNTGVTLYGAFMSSSSTKAGTTGTLSAASLFSASRVMVSGDKLNVTYTLNISST